MPVWNSRSVFVNVPTQASFSSRSSASSLPSISLSSLISASSRISVRSRAARRIFWAFSYSLRFLLPSSFSISSGLLSMTWIFSYGRGSNLCPLKIAVRVRSLKPLTDLICFSAFHSLRMGGYLLPAGTAATVDVLPVTWPDACKFSSSPTMSSTLKEFLRPKRNTRLDTIPRRVL